MIFRSFRLKVIIRIALTGAVMGALVFCISQGKWYVATGVSAVLVLILMIELFYFIDRSNRDLYNLLLSLKHKDFSQSVATRFSERSFRELQEMFIEIRNVYRDASIEREVHYQYLQFIINHINVTLICIRSDGTISLFNPAARKMLGVTSPDHINIIKNISTELYEVIQKLSAGQSELIRLILRGELMQLSIYVTEFKLQDIPHKLVSIQNIKEELENQELESWQKLIRVLTHEIMNSVTPISSLSSALNEMLMEEGGERKPVTQIPADDLDDMYKSLQTIEDRSKGLLKFVSHYKDLTRLPHPVFMNIKLEELFDHISSLMKKEMDKQNITFEVYSEGPELTIYADKDMILQVLINLLANARDALERKKNKKIKLTGFRMGEKIFIQVSDNGPGIDQESIDKVFIPFFTTKKKGSGIGLSLARQIMRLHKGSIYFNTEEGKGTIFTLEF
jgi:two-component system, NtrC family, nitrogen regulation sensor histidine kinase NtrY